MTDVMAGAEPSEDTVEFDLFSGRCGARCGFVVIELGNSSRFSPAEAEEIGLALLKMAAVASTQEGGSK